MKILYKDYIPVSRCETLNDNICVVYQNKPRPRLPQVDRGVTVRRWENIEEVRGFSLFSRGSDCNVTKRGRTPSSEVRSRSWGPRTGSSVGWSGT